MRREGPVVRGFLAVASVKNRLESHLAHPLLNAPSNAEGTARDATTTTYQQADRRPTEDGTRGSTMQTNQAWGGFARLMDELDEMPIESGAAVAVAEEMERYAGMDYCPTPEQIRAECARIQSGWSERERWRRAGHSSGRAPRWQPPQTAMPQFDNSDLAWAV